MFGMSHNPATIINEWLRIFASHRDLNSHDDPSYYCDRPEELASPCIPVSFETGTGEQLLKNVLRECLSAQREVLIVTCFWAKSSSQELVATFLKDLSFHACQENRNIRVCISFSSRSLTQKLFHTASLDGEQYTSSQWVTKLGLPPDSELPGLQLSVKSIFVRPFSVMHPKFIIVDRERIFLPSCNVSWEDWFEGCVEFKGELVGKFFRFWSQFWDRDHPPAQHGAQQEETPLIDLVQNGSAESLINDEPRRDLTRSATPATPIFRSTFAQAQVPAVLLPSPHHIDPRWQPFSLSIPEPPPTPLNTFLLHIFDIARSTIFIQTPNITSKPVISALISALKRGVDVQLVTSTNLMLVEQIVTSGTITELSLWRLECKYRNFLKTSGDGQNARDEEALLERPGKLSISYYHPALPRLASSKEPVKSHLKLAIVDEEIVVLGSGNMDRASFYTSQELGVAFFSHEMAQEIKAGLDGALGHRIDTRVITRSSMN